MGWFFRKSASFGPFRLNFSKSGIGLSFGVRGARISTGRRGTFVNLGKNGIYYRQRIDGARRSRSSFYGPPPLVSPDLIPHSITTDDVSNVTDADSHEFVRELETKAAKISLLIYFGLWPSIVLMLYVLSLLNDVVVVEKLSKQVFTIDKRSVNIRTLPSVTAPVIAHAKSGDSFDVVDVDSTGWVRVHFKRHDRQFAFVRADMGGFSTETASSRDIRRIEQQPAWKFGVALLTAFLILWCLYLAKVDRQRKTIELYYSLDDRVGELHRKFKELFAEFASCRKVWQKLNEVGVADSKYHAGASRSVTRARINGIALDKLPSRHLKTNISVPFIGLRNTELYFFPERLILKRGKKFGAVFYKNLRVEKEQVRFVESEGVPADATVVDHTWKYLNKRGGPDKRFSGNHQIPVCLYTEYHFQSEQGINEIITTSRSGGMDGFCDFLKVIGEFQKTLG